MKRILGFGIILAVALVLRPDIAVQLRARIWPVAPAALTVQMRPDLLESPENGQRADEAPDLFPLHAFDFAGRSRRFYALPAEGTAGKTTLPPVILLLHGSGRDGRAMLDMWHAIAAKGALLVAPGDPIEASPSLLRKTEAGGFTPPGPRGVFSSAVMGPEGGRA